MVHLRSICVGDCICDLFLVAEWNFIVWVSTNLFIHPQLRHFRLFPVFDDYPVKLLLEIFAYRFSCDYNFFICVNTWKWNC